MADTREVHGVQITRFCGPADAEPRARIQLWACDPIFAAECAPRTLTVEQAIDVALALVQDAIAQGRHG
ncbi:MAG TPA: hypothetical protein VMP89_05910 [Solirubrobacteraceae bacterium]|nr:hypothetical protein [Solirubrobacteraceae bacterium]